MSAREALYWALWDNYTQAQKNEFIDAFVHELAEMQRDERPQHNPDWQAWGDAADLIDPLKDAP
ncbi:hypothetical protein [Streptomyces sp. NPDC050121]|uniref:hypothetical protein n=1 Tax=Streptomyces sp. NPDC050121 TaxID=3365601 RepID=UPI00378E4ADE